MVTTKINNGDSLTYAFTITGVEATDILNLEFAIGNLSFTLANGKLVQSNTNPLLFYIYLLSKDTFCLNGNYPISIAINTGLLGVLKKNLLANLSVVKTNTKMNLPVETSIISATFDLTVDDTGIIVNEYLQLIAKGEKGDQGIQGIQGQQGIQGIKGDKGDKGDPGDVQTLQSVTDLGSATTNQISSDVGFFIGENDNVAYLSKQNEILSIYIQDMDTEFGSNIFAVSTEDGISYDKIQALKKCILRIKENLLSYTILDDNDNDNELNSFVVDEFSTSSKNGFKSLWGEFGDNGEFSAGTYYDGLTRRFYFFSGAADYGYAQQSASIYTSAEEGISMQATGTDGALIFSSSIYNSVDELFLRKSFYNIDTSENFIDNELKVNYSDTYSLKSYSTDEGYNGSFVFFNTGASEGNVTGKLTWNDIDGTLNLGLKGDNATLKLGQENLVRVVNKSGSTITKGKVVKVISNAGGTNTAISLAQANSDANSSSVIGITTENIGNNGLGFVTIQGTINDVNTNSFNEGDALYLSPTTAGALTNVKPIAPNYMVIIGYVAKKGISDGSILVDLQNGYELEELHNVKINSQTNNQLLAYNSSNLVWENKSLSDIGGQSFFKNLPYKYFNPNQSIGSNASGETQLIRVEIPANTFSSSDKLYFRFGLSKTGTINPTTIRAKITTSPSMPVAGASVIATGSISTTALYCPVERTMAINGGNLKGFSFASANVSDSATSTAAWSSVAFDVTQTQYFYVSATPAAITTDVSYLEYLEITNI